MTCPNSKTDSDSVNLGSNPSPPATFFSHMLSNLADRQNLMVYISLKLLSEKFES
jgi:hypothetical protein